MTNLSLIIHFVSDLFTCECGKSYTRKGNLVRHQKYECGGKIKNYVCMYCKTAFLYKHVLDRHVKRIHQIIDNIIY